jgi:hypothetical protein
MKVLSFPSCDGNSGVAFIIKPCRVEIGRQLRLRCYDTSQPRRWQGGQWYPRHTHTLLWRQGRKSVLKSGRDNPAQR